MAKSDRIKKMSEQQDVQEATKDQVAEAQEPVTQQAPKKPRKAPKKAEPVEPVQQDVDDVLPGIPPEPVEVTPDVEQQSEPEPQASEELTPEQMREKAEQLKATLKNELDRIEAQKKRCEDKIQALIDAAEAAEAEERAKREAEEKAKAEAEARERAKAEAKAKAKADLLASVNKAQRHVGKAYKWWDYETGTWNITTDVWSANQLSDKWEVIYVWYKDGEIERLLNKEELDKHCPR